MNAIRHINKIKKKTAKKKKIVRSHQLTQKTCDKTEHPFVIKALSELETQKMPTKPDS